MSIVSIFALHVIPILMVQFTDFDRFLYVAFDDIVSLENTNGDIYSGENIMFPF